MTVAKAADVYEETKREIDRLKPQLDAAAEVLKEYFRKSGKQTYRKRIAYAVLSRRQLDSRKVKAELADRLEEFEKRVTYETLSLLN